MEIIIGKGKLLVYYLLIILINYNTLINFLKLSDKQWALLQTDLLTQLEQERNKNTLLASRLLIYKDLNMLNPNSSDEWAFVRTSSGGGNTKHLNVFILNKIDQALRYISETLHLSMQVAERTEEIMEQPLAEDENEEKEVEKVARFGTEIVKQLFPPVRGSMPEKGKGKSILRNKLPHLKLRQSEQGETSDAALTSIGEPKEVIARRRWGDDTEEEDGKAPETEDEQPTTEPEQATIRQQRQRQDRWIPSYRRRGRGGWRNMQPPSNWDVYIAPEFQGLTII